MLRSTVIVLVVAGLAAAGVAAALLRQQDPLGRRAQDGPIITRSTLIVIDKDGAHACSSWAGATGSCALLESSEPEGPAQAD